MSQALLVVDVQPAYGSFSDCIAKRVAQRINNTCKPVLIYWVGEGLTEDTEQDVYDYLRKAGAYRPRLDQATFVEKGYGFYRQWMDNGVPPEMIVNAGIAMNEQGLYSSSQLDLESLFGDQAGELPRWGDITRPGFNDARLLACDGFETCGGGREECLAEMELFLQIHHKPYARLEHLVY